MSHTENGQVACQGSFTGELLVGMFWKTHPYIVTTGSSSKMKKTVTVILDTKKKKKKEKQCTDEKKPIDGSS